MVSASGKTPSRDSEAKLWTVLVFMVPSGDLEGFALDDVGEMTRACPADRFNLAVQMHRPTGSDRFTIAGGAVRFVDDPPLDTVRGSLASFLDWGFSEYPSRRRMVVLWGHSYGVGLDLFSPRQDQRGSGATAGVRTMVPRPPLQSLLTANGQRNGRERERDPRVVNGSSAYSLSIGALSDVVTTVSRRHGVIDLLGMDSCFMASAEAAYQLKEAARYLLASESWIRKEGWNYAHAFGALSRHPGIEPEELGRQIVYDTAGEATRSISLLDLRQTSTLADHARACVTHLLGVARNDDDARRALQLRLAQTSFMNVRQFVDLRDLVTRVKEALGDPEGQLAAWDRSIAQVIAARKAVGEGLGSLRGLSIYYPWVDARISLGVSNDTGEVNAVVDPDEYRQLEFVQATRWNDLLRTLNPERALAHA
jgi:Clostripain family